MAFDATFLTAVLDEIRTRAIDASFSQLTESYLSLARKAGLLAEK